MRSTLPFVTRNMRIGLLGGSFNPAHEGHVHISIEALKKLKLTEVWWLVSPQNPLKSDAQTKPLEIRIATAEGLISHPNIRVTQLETILGTRYTIDTLTEIKKRFPQVHFVWLMGADNLQNFDQWKKWPEIFKTMPIAIMDRPDFGLKVLSSKPALRFKQYRIDDEDATELVTRTPPCWSFIPIKLNQLSSTKIRARENTRKKS